MERSPSFVGSAISFIRIVEQIPALAKSDATVLIKGETGTGKELVARSIHCSSSRKGFPFVVVNCGSFSESLLEDELFGHERGSFTNALVSREGLIAHADKGTLFLDEIDSLSAKGQVNLLRVLQERKFRPIGSNIERQSDVRILAATNRSLNQLVLDGKFRADLYYRLCVLVVELPPLRERNTDIPSLVRYFLEKHGSPSDANVTLTKEAFATLLAHDWPGNVRELENVILRAIHLRSKNDRIEQPDLGLHLHNTLPREPKILADGRLGTFKGMKRELIERFEKAYLVRLLSEHAGNVSQAARVAEKSGEIWASYCGSMNWIQKSLELAQENSTTTFE